MKKGDICEGIVERYTFPNKGYVNIEDREICIKGALKGQKVRFSVKKLRKGNGEGRLLEVLEKAPMEDAIPACPHFGQCGGCTYLTMSYENQLRLKEEQVKSLLQSVVPVVCDAGADGSGNEAAQNAPWQGEAEEGLCQETCPQGGIREGLRQEYSPQGGIREDLCQESCLWEGIKGSPVQEAYRNKMEFSFGDAFKGGPLALGMHKKGSFHDIVTVDHCRIVDSDYTDILRTVLDFYTEKQTPFYKKMQHTGVLRHLVVRQAACSGDILVNLVTTTQDLDSLYLEELKERLLSLKLHGRIAGILHTHNDSLSDAVVPEKVITLYGQDYIYENILGLTFRISPFSFFQTNSRGAEVLYETARSYVGDTRDKVIFDLYSGTGTIAQMLAPVAKKVIGVEIVEEAVEAARENAKLNGLTNCEFIAGDVLKVIDEIAEQPDIIVLDPPRDGINPKALDKIIAYGVEEIVYISCKPTSLVRDLAVLTGCGYRVVKACAVDQFVGTVHVESIVLLSKPHTFV